MRTINEIKRAGILTADMIPVKKELYKKMIIKCRKNKTSTCLEKILPNEFKKQKIYMDDDNNLYYRVENLLNLYEYGYIADGIYECQCGCGWFDTDEILEIEEMNFCIECGIKIHKKKVASLKIANWFLKCKYNPNFKYCRDRMEDLYNKEFDDDYVEGEKICL
tara:strand:+ start:467 stop:958 length:492 start_codon:yes stop_codon:yes gene_type:complete